MKLGFDILILLSLAGCGVGGFFLGDERAQRLMIGSLIGVFAATQLAAPIAKLVPNLSLLNFTNLSFIIVAVCIVVFVLPKRLRDSKWPKNKPRATISGVLSGLFLFAYGISFLDLGAKTALVTDHNLAAMAYDLRLLLLSALLIWLGITILMIGKAKR